MTSFLKNAWYVAAWPDEVGQSLLARMIIGEPLVLFRRRDGTAVALHDRCPHRFTPLSLGKLLNDRLECRYHGLQFDCTGNCVLNPHPPGTIPPNMAVRTYPLVERHGLLWIWMGESSRAKLAEVPDLAYLTDGAWRTIRSYFHFSFGADLLVDNLMDLSHVEFLHKGSLSEGYQEETKASMTTVEAGNTVRVSWVLRNTVPTPYIRKTFRDIGPLADDHRDTHWQPPGIVKVELAYVNAGAPRDRGMLRIHTHCATPETHRAMHDFTMRSRNFSLDDEEMDRVLLKTQRIVVLEEDGLILTQIQQRMGDADFDSLNPVLFHVDAGAAKVRRVMKRLIEAEATIG